MFITSIYGSAELGSWPEAGDAEGVAAGDAICQEVAKNLPNSQDYRAWLSTESDDAYCRMLGGTGKRTQGCTGGIGSAGPWLRMDDTIFAGGLDELVTVGPRRPPVLDESGLFREAVSATGTLADGTLDSDATCSDWLDGNERGLVGRSERTFEEWTEFYGSWDCAEFLRLMCFEIGAAAPASEVDVPAATVFVSSARGPGALGDWPIAGDTEGLAAGDAICRKLAKNAGLSGAATFVAWLGEEGENALDRLPHLAGPWERVDGVPAARIEGDKLRVESSLSVTEAGDPVASYVWSGADRFGQWDEPTCTGWTSSGGTGVAGRSNWPARQLGLGNHPCTLSNRLYCFGSGPTLWEGGFESGDLSGWTEAEVAP